MAADIILGSCCYESKEETERAIQLALKHGYDKVRTMLFKPRTDKNSFQGFGLDKLPELLELQAKYPNITFVIEIMSIEDDEILFKSGLKYIAQIGARNAQNYALLKALGSYSGRTYLLKNGLAMTTIEFLKTGEYLNPNNNHIIYCFRGVRSVSDNLRFTPNIGSMLEFIIQMENSPNKYDICFDPSHIAGDRVYVNTLAKVGLACGANMLEVEVHSDPDSAWSDSAQTISFKQFEDLVNIVNNF